METKSFNTTRDEAASAAKKYSGVDVDMADDEKVSAEMVKESVKMMNNNHAGDNDYNPS